MNTTAERVELLKVQSLESAEAPTIEAALDAQTRTVAALWTGFVVFVGGVMAAASRELAVAVGGMLLASLVYALLRRAGRSRSEKVATLTQKFITRKKRREYVVLGGRSWRVSGSVYARMTVGARYRIYSNASGAVIFDLESRSPSRSLQGDPAHQRGEPS